MVFVAGEMVFVVGGTVFAMDKTVFAMDDAVLPQSCQPVARQSAAFVTFSLHLGKAPAPSGAALYTRAV